MAENDDDKPSWEHDDLVHGYWVIPGGLLATEYPGARNHDKALQKLEALLDAGITSFVDLTERDETTWGGSPMLPYDGLLGPEITYRRFPIPDTKTITDAGYDRILGHIRAELDTGKVVLVHCWGGKGRTGTIVGAWLIENNGLGYSAVIERMQELRAGSCKADHPVPDTEEQYDVLRRRSRGRQG